MEYALDLVTGERRTPHARGDRARCPSCSSELLGKVGTLVCPHWSHRGAQDCDPWVEPETAWHRDWKACVDPEYREVVLGPHRADICLNNGVVVELQHSSISPEEIYDRESFYKDMIWLFDTTYLDVRLPDAKCHCYFESNDFGTRRSAICEECAKPLHLSINKWARYWKDVSPFKTLEEGQDFSVTWKHARRSWMTAKKPLYMDLGSHGILKITRVEEGRPFFGRVQSAKVFREWLRQHGTSRTDEGAGSQIQENHVTRPKPRVSEGLGGQSQLSQKSQQVFAYTGDTCELGERP